MRYSLLAYNKDKDIYDAITGSDNKEELKTLAGELVFKLNNEESKDKSGEVYDWLELWDEGEYVHHKERSKRACGNME